MDANAQMALVMAQQWAAVLPVVSITSIIPPSAAPYVQVTCSSPHGLQTNAQVSIEGVTNAEAAGAYSITVTTATAFTYQTNQPIPAGGLMTSGTRVVTMNAGLPYGFTQIPQTGV